MTTDFLFPLPTRIHYNITHFNEINSTQTYAKDNADTLPEGAVIIADTQTASYGRLERKWQSNAGGLWFSIILKPRLSPDKCLCLSLIASLILADTVNEMYNINARVKWPNDVMIKNNKLAGIILEMRASRQTVNWLAVGIGVNVNNDVGNTAGISVKESINKPADGAQLLEKFIINFDKAYSTFQTSGFAPFQKKYNALLNSLGKQISVDTGTEIKTGTALGADENGYLVLEATGKTFKIISGTIIK
jgi:BirA family biotin operon repressor/biotin-[acetyl-CoA-carboxylase] ligase